MASVEKTGRSLTNRFPSAFDAPLYTVGSPYRVLLVAILTWTQPLGHNVTIITHDRFPEMAYGCWSLFWPPAGIPWLSLDGHLIRSFDTGRVSSDKTPLIMEKGKLPEGYDGLSTHIITIENGDATEIQRALQILGSKTSQIDVYAPTNTLIITDTADGLRRMFAFLEEADVPGFDTSMEIFTLEYTRAEVLAGQITQVLLGDGSAPTGRPGAAPQQMPPSPVRPVRATRPTTAPQQSSQVIGSREEVLRMVPDERLNSLIVVATEDMMTQVRDLVKRLDTPTPYEANNMHIYQLLNADAEAVETAIQPLIGTAPRKATGGGAGGGGGAPVAPGGGGGGAAGATDVQPFEQKVQITRYDQANSLLIVASPQDYKLLESFIARLDVPQRQVCVEAVVMEVKMTDDFGLAVDTASIGGNDGFAMTSTDNLTTLLDAATAAEQIVGGPRAAIRNAALGLGTEGKSGLTLGVVTPSISPGRARRSRSPSRPCCSRRWRNSRIRKCCPAVTGDARQ